MANEWNVSYPLDHTKVGSLPGEIRKLKDSVKDQIDREHETPVDGDATGSEHSLGSAVLYIGTSAPTNRPDGATALASNNIDKGRIWLDTNYTPPALKYWDGDSWETLGILVVGASPTQCFLISTTAEDSDGGRESQVRAKGTQSGAEVTTLGMIEFSHEGASDDQKGQMKIIVNDGDDSDTPSKVALVVKSTGKIDASESLSILDEDNMASDDADVLATQQSIKAYVDSLVGSSYHLISVGGTPTKVYTKYFTGNLDADAETAVAHGVTNGLTKILHVSGSAVDDTTGRMYTSDSRASAVTNRGIALEWDGTNVYFASVGSFFQSNAYVIKVDYIL